MQTRSRKKLSTPKKILFSSIITIFFSLIFIILYCVSVATRCSQNFQVNRRWGESPFANNKEFGFFPRAGILGWQELQHSEKIPVLYDESGFRIPQNPELSQTGKKPSILFLGCSFTHGYGLPAEKTFPYLSADKVGAYAMNAGQPAWGLAQILIFARKIIPALKPDYVILQYSPWLLNRSQKTYGSTNMGKTPVPFFYKKNNQLFTHSPVFESYNKKPFTPPDDGKQSFTSFFLESLPQYIHDDYWGLMTELKRTLGIIPNPIKDRQFIINNVYGEISDICNTHGSKLIILKLEKDFNREHTEDDLSFLKCPIIDTYPALVSKADIKSSEEWKKKYCFWRGSPPKIVDDHPNEKAHEIIAELIASTISQQEKDQTHK